MIGWKHIWKKHRIKMTLVVFSLLIMGYSFCLPTTLFNDPYSTVLEAENGALLSASIATDGQWRFPEVDTISPKFLTALISYEDKRFYHHLGIDVLSLGKAFVENIKAGKVVRGGSTISMQVVRLSRKNKSRTLYEKLVEIVLATRLELRYSKSEILTLYASHAPFGGNVVGLDAACWRYFGRASTELSWAEASMLAVLPNAPSLIHLGKNRELLKSKRDALLDRLVQLGHLDEFSATLAKEEQIPQHPLPLPRHARHLLLRLRKEGHQEKKVVSTLQENLQLRVEQLLQDHSERWKHNQIGNGAVLVAEVKTGRVLAYVGNVEALGVKGTEVDIINARRSTGSILKPLLYATMLEDGKMLPSTLWPDVPTFVGGFSPKNFSRQYDGAVAADDALIRSLNIPFVHMLRDYRYERFHALLQKMGMTTLTRHPDHYGLSLILGGAEGTLWDITGMYASLARIHNEFYERPGKNKYAAADIHPLTYLSTAATATSPTTVEANGPLSVSSIYTTFDVLKELYRPGDESGWRHFQSSKQIAWKTGTSYGFRDAWAIGVTPEYVVGVWMGNASGEGRAGLTGTDVAAPLLFDVFSALPKTSWFKKPALEMELVTVCTRSGQRNSEECDKVDTISVNHVGLQTSMCTYHKSVYLSADGKYRVHSGCTSLANAKKASWFVLPPLQEYYYRSKNISYLPLPPFRDDCITTTHQSVMEMVYPKDNAKLFLPRTPSGEAGSVILELAHSYRDVVAYWHLDGDFIGATENAHRLVVQPSFGKHSLMVIDQFGEAISLNFEVISKM